MSKESYINDVRPHDSAYKHVSGYAEYTDDINEPKNTIYGAIGLSKKAHARIKKIDLSDVKKSEGVISVVTQSDILGRNDVGPVFDGDPIFPKSKVEYYGQPLFAVAATTTEFARKAVLKAKIIYKNANEETLKDKIKEYEEKFSNPYIAASRGYIDEVIKPDITRSKVIDAFKILRNKKLKNPWKKHDNIPL